MHTVSWLCKAPSPDGCLVNLPSPASLSRSCPFLSPDLIQPCCSTCHACVDRSFIFTWNIYYCLVYSFPHLLHFLLKIIEKERRKFYFLFPKVTYAEQGSAEQCPRARGYSQHPTVTAPVLSHGAPSQPATSCSTTVVAVPTSHHLQKGNSCTCSCSCLFNRLR